MLFFVGACCKRGHHLYTTTAPSYHILASYLPHVGHSSNYEYHCCQLTRQSSCVSNFYRTFKVFICLSLVHSFDSQADLTALDSFQLHSNLVRDYHQTMVKPAKHSRMQLVWVPGHMGTDGNATADLLTTHGSSNPLTGSQPALGTCAKVAGRVIRG
jgi:hypothetical protein